MRNGPVIGCFYEMMVELLSKTTNQLPFQLHWDIIRTIIKQNGMQNIKNLSADRLAQYGLYLLCMHIAKNKGSIDPNSP